MTAEQEAALRSELESALRELDRLRAVNARLEALLAGKPS